MGEVTAAILRGGEVIEHLALDARMPHLPDSAFIWVEVFNPLDVPCIGTDVKPYFRDVHDQLVRLDGMISRLVDVIRAVFEASNLLEQQQQGASLRAGRRYWALLPR